MDEPVTSNDVRVAACTIMLEVAHADGRLTSDERKMITRSLVQHFGVDERGAQEIMAAAESQMGETENDWQAVQQLVSEYDQDQRIMLGEMLHQIGSADGWLDGNEEFIIARLEQLLGVNRTEFVRK
jgi:uncharacterized tellurite resistance protein B-like protein